MAKIVGAADAAKLSPRVKCHQGMMSMKLKLDIEILQDSLSLGDEPHAVAFSGGSQESGTGGTSVIFFVQYYPEFRWTFGQEERDCRTGNPNS